MRRCRIGHFFTNGRTQALKRYPSPLLVMTNCGGAGSSAPCGAAWGPHWDGTCSGQINCPAPRFRAVGPKRLYGADAPPHLRWGPVEDAPASAALCRTQALKRYPSPLLVMTNCGEAGSSAPCGAAWGPHWDGTCSGQINCPAPRFRAVGPKRLYGADAPPHLRWGPVEDAPASAALCRTQALKRYPSPLLVMTNCGEAGSSSTFSRSRRTATSTARTSPT